MRSYEDLHKYQRFAIAQGVNLGYVAYFLGTGLGKTIIYLGVIDQLLKRGLIQNVLIVSTKKVVYNTFRQEAQQWEPTKDLTFSIIHGNAYSGSAEASRRRGFHSDAQIKLINCDGLPWLAKHLQRKGYDGVNAKFPFQCIIYDESTKMKHSTTQRFKVFKKYMSKFRYRFIGTGTPIPNGLMDLFGQMYVLDLGETLGTVLGNYRSRYFMQFGNDPANRKYLPIKTAREAIQKRIRKRVIYMKKQDYVELPPIHYNPILLDLPNRLRGQYDELEDTFFLELAEAKVEAFSTAALSMKLRQYLQGSLYTYGEDSDKRVTLDVHSEKLDYLKELVDTSKGSTRILEGIGNCIIAYNFHFEREDLLKLFPDAPVIDGSAKDSAVTAAIEGWNRGLHPILLFNPASDPHGLNLQFGGNQVLWYSLTWNLEHYMQLIDRLWRQLQKRTVFVHHLLFRNTVDEVIFGALTAKDAEQESLLHALKQYRQTATGGSPKGN